MKLQSAMVISLIIIGICINWIRFTIFCIASTQFATQLALAIKRALNILFCRRSDGYPTLRLISAYSRYPDNFADLANAMGSLPPNC